MEEYAAWHGKTPSISISEGDCAEMYRRTMGLLKAEDGVLEVGLSDRACP